MTFAKVLAPLFALSLAACATVPDQRAAEPVTIGIVGLNDFHGNLEPITRPVKLGDGREAKAGGAAWLASAVDAVRAKHKNTMVIAAGDLIGASPLVSSLFLDEPTIGAMNRIGLDFNAVGNHEFDKGWRELKRVQDGGCEKLTLRDPCAVEPDFAGADFAFLAANVAMEDGGTLFPAYGIKTFETPAGEIKIGVIGLTLKETPTLVTPSGVDGLTSATRRRRSTAPCRCWKNRARMRSWSRSTRACTPMSASTTKAAAGSPGR